MPKIITLTPNPTYDFAVNADFVEPNRKLRCKNPKTHPGGGGLNVARAASRLGVETLAIFTAGGLYGEALHKAVAAEGLAMRIIPVEHETRLAFHVRDESKDHEYRFNLPGGGLDKHAVEAFLEAIREEAGEGDFVVGSGSLPSDAPKDFWALAARAAKQNNAKFVLDSIHGVREALDEGIYLLRQNKFEYQAISGGDLKWPEEITSLCEKIVTDGGAERVTITHGGDGSVMARMTDAGIKLSRANSFKVKANSAVGAGDSFVGGLLVALANGKDDNDALSYAMAAAGATRMSPGTALFKPADVEQLYQQTE
ncbi:MAG: phosphofructokinase [Hyphococcus sp.]|nr:MAG: phosphofructokinase [Marinicaulis sp.]